MGESTTKPEFWLVSLGFIIVLTFGLLAFGNSIRYSQEITLDNDSQTYMDNYYSKLDKYGINETAHREPTEEDAQNPVQRVLGSIREFFDVFGIFSLLTTVLAGLWTFITMMFNMPTFFLETLGLPIENFKFLINTVSFILTLSATIMLVRLKK